MSLESTVWAWHQDCSSTQKLVLLAMADHADHEGVCWPGSRGLAEKTRLARSTVTSAIRALVKNDLIKAERRKRKDGSYVSNRYLLGTVSAEGVVGAGQRGTVREPDQGGPTVGPGVDREPDTMNLPDESSNGSSKTYTPEFERAWAAYGRKGAKGTAAKEYAKAVKILSERGKEEPHLWLHAKAALFRQIHDANNEPRYRKDFERWLKGQEYDFDEAALRSTCRREDRKSRVEAPPGKYSDVGIKL